MKTPSALPDACARRACTAMFVLGIGHALAAMLLALDGALACSEGVTRGSDWGGLPKLLGALAGALAVVECLVSAGLFAARKLVRNGSNRSAAAAITINAAIAAAALLPLGWLWMSNDSDLLLTLKIFAAWAIWAAPHARIIWLLTP